jgi:hypothetical protein
MMRFNHQRLVVLRTGFSLVGFGFVVCQPATDKTFEGAMAAYRAGNNFAFMTKESWAAFWPVAFGCQRCLGNETCFHSHLGEGLS